MRILLLSFLLLWTESLMAYNAGQKARSSFGPAVSEVSETSEEVAEPQRTSFTASTYSQSRLNTSAKTKEEQPLPTAPKEEEAIAQAPVFPVAQASVPAGNTGSSNWKMKMAAPKDFTVKQMQTAEPKPQTKDVKKPGNSPQDQEILPAEQPAIPAEATAALEKMGDLQKMMNGLGGSTGGAGAGGLPDLSALMGGGKGSATPAKK